MPADLLLVVPPPVRSTMGPLLGPAIIAGAVGERGFQVAQRDLAIRFVKEAAATLYQAADDSTGLTGDHAKSSSIQTLAARLGAEWSGRIIGPGGLGQRERSLAACAYEDHELDAAVGEALHGDDNRWRDFFDRYLLKRERAPRILGISLLYAGQVLPSLILSAMARERWPKARIVWGGALITLLRDELPRGELATRLIDAFVVGRGEETASALLSQAVEEWPGIPGVAGPGGVVNPALPPRSRPAPTPRFARGELRLYRTQELTLPYQLSTGCAAGSCAYCTYPAVEGEYVADDVQGRLRQLRWIVAQTGVRRFSFKDSFFTCPRLEEAATTIMRDRLAIEWSASTRVGPQLDSRLIALLGHSGLRTLELGLETAEPSLQVAVGKRQRTELVPGIIAACKSADVRVVVNRIRRLPGSTLEHERRDDAFFGDSARAGADVEENVFELQRGTPMALDPERYGLRIVKTWPWSPTLAWRPLVGAVRSLAA